LINDIYDGFHKKPKKKKKKKKKKIIKKKKKNKKNIKNIQKRISLSRHINTFSPKSTKIKR
jgi:hypothetical protein